MWRFEATRQTSSALLQGAVNHPRVSRARIIEAIKFLNRPMSRAQIMELRRAYREFQHRGEVDALLAAVEELGRCFGDPQREAAVRRARPPIGRQELRLICFDRVSGD